MILRRPDLRWPIPAEVETQLPGQRIAAIRRRAKYLLLDTAAGSALLHLGMSGSLRVLPGDTPVRTHDHVDLSLEDGRVLRFNDPRRFGCLLWQPVGETHELLRDLGPEPLDGDFDGDYLFARSRGRSASIKTFLMDQRIVVGVGNIYAAESLFMAGINPLREAGKVSLARYQRLADAVKQILATPLCGAVPPCAISSAPTEPRATSNRSCWCTDGKARPASSAGATCATPPSASGPLSGVGTANAERAEAGFHPAYG